MQGTLMRSDEWRGWGATGAEAMDILAEAVAKSENPYFEITNKDIVLTRGIPTMLGQTQRVFIYVELPLPGGRYDSTFMRVRKRKDIERWLDERDVLGWARIWVAEHSKAPSPIRTDIMLIQPVDGI